MSRQFRNRVTAIVLGGLVLGAPLVGGTARAEQLGAAVGREVTFVGGGILDLSCSSAPDIESMVVPADSTVRVVNRTGFSARLQLSGETEATLADDDATDVVFRWGTTEVQLKPNCPLAVDVTPVLVTASPSATPELPVPPSWPPGEDPDISITLEPSELPPAEVPTSTLPDTPPPTTHTHHPTPTHTRQPAHTSTVARTPTSTPKGDNSEKTKVKSTPGGTSGSTVPASTGVPLGDKKTVLPAVPPIDSDPTTQEPAPVAPTAKSAEVAAAEPVAMASSRESTPLGLLGLVAAVCVMGVAAAAIRAFVSQRANRANVA